MAEQNNDQEKTQPATPKKLSEAREKGDIPRSRELTTMLLLLGAAGMFYLSSRHFFSGLEEIFNMGFSLNRAQIFDEYLAANVLMASILSGLVALIPLMAFLAIVAVLGPLAVGGWAFNPGASGFKWNRLNPLAGLKRVFGARGLVEMLKALAKFGLILGFALTALYADFDRIRVLGLGALDSDIVLSGSIVFRIFLVTALATLLIALIDVPFQLWEYGRKHRMSHQEIKDELKQHEGSPETRSRIRGLQQELANRRMMEAVPNADVIITNPTHYAVALRFDPQTMAAPVVLAKGADQVALRIREVGKQHRIAIVSAPPLARALHGTTKLNQEIPAGLYLAVAQVLAYVFQLDQRARQSTLRSFEDLPIPPEFDY